MFPSLDQTSVGNISSPVEHHDYQQAPNSLEVPSSIIDLQIQEQCENVELEEETSTDGKSLHLLCLLNLIIKEDHHSFKHLQSSNVQMCRCLCI